MQVSAEQVRISVNAKYTLWDGEMVVRVVQHTGVYGFHSAAIVVERMDAPLIARTASWYNCAAATAGKPKAPMLEWIAEQLTELSTGKALNLGGVGSVEGLRK
jgi:hypothetical protein